MGTTPIVNTTRGGQVTSVFSAWLDRFETRRRPGPAPATSRCPLSFTTSSSLAARPCSARRYRSRALRGQDHAERPSHAPANGTLIFGETPDDSVPQLAAIFVPKGLDLTGEAEGPVPVHLFFSPSTGRKTGKYPFSDEQQFQLGVSQLPHERRQTLRIST